MIITQIHKSKTRLSIINNIPKKFFLKIEESENFGSHLFPSGVIDVFNNTDLKIKFQEVYDIYKAIANPLSRARIVNAFTQSNKIEELCSNDPNTTMILLSDLPLVIRPSIDKLFLYLYNTSINYHGFQAYTKDTLRETINRFITKNKIVICPFCGLESFINIEGQARLSLDHWLCKDFFPMSAVNLNNLVPIGQSCNQRPAKGNKNVLLDELNNRTNAYYPYTLHDGINVTFNFINEPNGHNIEDEDWDLVIEARNPIDESKFQNWLTIMNINIRFNDYLRTAVLPLWESDYREHIEDIDNDLLPATNMDELRYNFRNWKSTFIVKGRPGSIIYRAFIDYLIYRASNEYLIGLIYALNN
ncbi:hypothetical protein INQ45_05110 [Flavobacterium columnare]|uniref:hypothetical protein n=1 Tax=Flavobacterium columnare TaxID=996 RepID=UPI002D204074|nr:hypothetical protein [Flavobacterium columnare]MEB3800470.1 hypothetical protein [Flavobacterium columnare]